jgi:hypothetical protein
MTALWMQANGAMEHQNRDVLKRLCIAQANGENWRVAFVNIPAGLQLYTASSYS